MEVAPCNYEGSPLPCMIRDNHFTLQSLDHGNVGPNNMGNLMDMYKILHRVKEAAEMGDVILVTAGGSIN
jgi:hypothetical protein